jgi:molybdopterin molybdotransferase
VLSVADALARVLADARALPPIEAGLISAHGRVLADDVKALRTQPPAAVSAMDGYAVRAADVVSVPTNLRVIGEVAAGRPFEQAVGPGQAVRVFTGGVVPSGADTIVIQEHATRVGDQVAITRSSSRGRHIRVEGLDFRAGDVLLARGRRLTGRDLTLAAAMNHPTVPVHREPKMALLATGDELVPPGSNPGPGQIVYSNGFALRAMAQAQGAQVIDLGLAPDRLDETIAAVRRAREAAADVLVTTGGASVGEYDLVQQAFAAEGMTLSFWKVAVRPGRPLMHGRIGDMHVLGLPGNPVSAFVCGMLFLIPLLRALSGRSDINLPVESAVLGASQPANDERADFLRAILKRDPRGQLVATPFPTQDSSMVGVLANANCLVVRDPYAPAAEAGTVCTIVRIPD